MTGRLGIRRYLRPWLVLAELFLLHGLAGRSLPAFQRSGDRIASQAEAVAAYGRLPLGFEPNVGQTDPRVRFLSRGGGFTFFLSPSQAVMVLGRPTPVGLAGAGPDRRVPTAAGTAAGAARSSEDPEAGCAVVRMTLAGADPAAPMAGLSRLPGRSHYLIGDDRSRWRTNVPAYPRVRCRNVYPGIDLIYYGDHRQLEYDFVVAPGADPRAIALTFEGQDRLGLAPNGDLLLGTAAGEIRQHRPIVYQEVNGTRRPVRGGYRLTGRGRVGFRVGPYDRSRPMILDPVIVYSTYLGASNEDAGYGIAVDAQGEAFVTGVTNSPDFPVTPGSAQTTFVGQPGCHQFGPCDDAFVAKLSADGSQLLYCTYLGGDYFEAGYGIAVDADGNAYVAGQTGSTNFPTKNAAQGPSFPAGSSFGDAFVSKLSPDGSQLLYSTFLGAAGGAVGYAIAADDNGGAYVAGLTGGDTYHAFAAKVDTLASGPASLAYMIPLAGSDSEEAYGIAVDGSGSAYVVGSTDSSDFPGPHPLQGCRGCGVGGSDAFIVKLDSNGTIVYGTFLGGSGSEIAYGVAVDALGQAYVTGQTDSADFPLQNALFAKCGGPGRFAPCSDAFVAKLNAAGSALVFSTYLGGGDADIGYGVAVDPVGNAYVTGFTASKDFPTKHAVQAACSLRGGFFCDGDAFVTKLNPDGTALLYSTYLGGGQTENADFRKVGIAVDAGGNAYVTGYTRSGDFPTVLPLQPTHKAGFLDAFVTKISGQITPVIFIPGISASQLIDKADGTEVWPGVLSNGYRLSLFPEDNPSPAIYAPDVLRYVPVPILGITAKIVYGPLLDALTSRGGFREYQVDGFPLRRTTRDCDISQMQPDPDDNPSLFVFAYDWRKDNAETARALKDYVGCVEKFFPGSRVNLLTHSMGSLVARRYILDNPNDHNVNAVISIGGPWLGGPKLINVLETGDFVPTALNSTIKYIVGSFTAAHQILPGPAWYDLGGPPLFGEAGWDLDGDGNPNELYPYPKYIDVVNRRHSRDTFVPGTTGNDFHIYSTAFGDQDDWSRDQTGVKYYHLYGVQSDPLTIAQVIATTHTFGPITHSFFDLKLTTGDGTVPRLSAERIGNGKTYNAPNANLIPFCSDYAEYNDLAEHTGLCSTPRVIDKVLALLQGSLLAEVPPSGPPACIKVTDQVPFLPPGAQGPRYRYMRVVGGHGVAVADDQGNSTAAVDASGIGGSVPGVAQYALGDEVEMAAIPARTFSEYTATFRTTDGHVALDITQGLGDAATQAIRYQDLVLPPNASGMIHFSSRGVDDLQYDSDGDGTFDTAVHPTLVVTGPDAADDQPPVVTVARADTGDSEQITLTATDAGTGVKEVRYSLDGVHFQLYAGPIQAARAPKAVVYAFADDNAGNRSPLLIDPIPVQGDANGDGVFDARDLAEVIRIYLGIDPAPPPGSIALSEIDVEPAGGDGILSARDLNGLLRLLLGLPS